MCIFCGDFITPFQNLNRSSWMGFPSPAADHADMPLNLHEHLVVHPAATFFWRYSGSAMDRAGIQTGALLVVDRSLTARAGDIVAAIHHGEPMVRKLLGKAGSYQLATTPLDGQPVVIAVDEETILWGVVVHAVNHLRAGALRLTVDG